ncbi:MAG: PaaI family thioesterase, partial [Rhodospirillales bacterium]
HFAQSDPLHLQMERLDDMTLRARMPIKDQHLRPGGTVSGPTLMFFCDAGFYLLVLSQIGPVPMAVTTNLNINFMRRPAPVDVIGEFRILKLGQRLAVGDAVLFSDGDKEAIAHCQLTYAIPPDRKKVYQYL